MFFKVALDYIGKRGSTIGVTKEKRIKYALSLIYICYVTLFFAAQTKSYFNRYAREILQREMLPHVGTEECCETKKAYYFGLVYALKVCCNFSVVFS